MIPTNEAVLDLVAEHLRAQLAGDWHRPHVLASVASSATLGRTTRRLTAAGAESRPAEASHPLIQRYPKRSRAERLLGNLDVLDARWRPMLERLASGYTRTEIGEQLGVPRKAVAQALEQALAAARMFLLAH